MISCDIKRLRVVMDKNPLRSTFRFFIPLYFTSLRGPLCQLDMSLNKDICKLLWDSERAFCLDCAGGDFKLLSLSIYELYPFFGVRDDGSFFFPFGKTSSKTTAALNI